MTSRHGNMTILDKDENVKDLDPIKIFVKNAGHKDARIKVGARSLDGSKEVIWYDGMLDADETLSLSGSDFLIRWKDDEEEQGQRVHESAAQGQDQEQK